MAELWYPNAVRNPGARAGSSQKVRGQCVKIHYTVGVNSTPIGLQGYFQWLVSRNGTIQQFAEADVVCWDSGEWNDAGPGIEIEYYKPKDGPDPDNIVTDAQIQATGGLIHWLHTEHGYPLDFYDGPRIAESSGFRGFITHRSLIQTEQHVDYITHAQWDAMVSDMQPVPVPELPNYLEEFLMFAENNDEHGKFYMITGGGLAEMPKQEALTAITGDNQDKSIFLGKVGGWVLQQWDDQLRGKQPVTIKVKVG